MTINNRNIIELREIRDDIQDMPSLISAINESIVEINYILRSLTLVNLDGQIKAVTIPAGQTLRISHRLRVVPKYRIIIAQTGGGTIVDGNFTRNYIELTNTGATDTTLSVIIVKE